MELQRILARDTRSAMEKVFNLHGEDAMIVANNKVKGQTEIIVALDLVSDVKAALNKPPEAPAAGSSEVSFDDFIDAQIAGKPLVMSSEPFSDSEIVSEPASQPLKKIASPIAVSARNFLTERPLDKASNALNAEEHKEAADREYLKAREIVDLVKQELSLMRNEFKMAQQKDSWTGTMAVTEEMRPLIAAFNETGMPLGLRESVVEVINQSDSMHEAIEEITVAMGDAIESVDLLNGMQGVHIIAGNSGSGKTLMAGRLAKQMAQQYGEDEVVLISYNDIRIGAWSQTQLIGSQAGVETFRATSIDMLTQLIAEVSARKLTIIDTSGVDIETHIEKLSAALPEAQKHLVVAADASEASAKRQLRADGLLWDSVMLSRFEGEVHPWAVISLLLNNPTPVSVAAVLPTIADSAIPLTGLTLAGQALSQLPLNFS